MLPYVFGPSLGPSCVYKWSKCPPQKLNNKNNNSLNKENKPNQKTHTRTNIKVNICTPAEKTAPLNFTRKPFPILTPPFSTDVSDRVC